MVLPHVIFAVFGERKHKSFESIETPLRLLKVNFIKILCSWKNGKPSSYSFDVAKCVDGMYFGCV